MIHKEFVLAFPERTSKMHIYTGIFFGLLWCLAGSAASPDYPDVTVKCVFQMYSTCYNDIASLGANFSARLDESPLQINNTCKSLLHTQQCILNVAPTCHAIGTGSVSERIAGFLNLLCTNGTQSHSNFLNASVCYNRQQSRRYDCYRKYNIGSKNDVKSLCCSTLRTHSCVREEMAHLCPRNATQFMGYLEEVLTSHEYAMCGPYLKQCSGAKSLASAFGTVLVAIVLMLLMYRRQ